MVAIKFEFPVHTLASSRHLPIRGRRSISQEHFSDVPLRRDVESVVNNWTHGNSRGIGDHDVPNEMQAYKVDSDSGDGAFPPRCVRGDHLFILSTMLSVTFATAVKKMSKRKQHSKNNL